MQSWTGWKVSCKIHYLQSGRRGTAQKESHSPSPVAPATHTPWQDIPVQWSSDRLTWGLWKDREKKEKKKNHISVWLLCKVKDSITQIEPSETANTDILTRDLSSAPLLDLFPDLLLLPWQCLTCWAALRDKLSVTFKMNNPHLSPERQTHKLSRFYSIFKLKVYGSFTFLLLLNTFFFWGSNIF